MLRPCRDGCSPCSCPVLSTDRTARARGGASWRSSAQAEPALPRVVYAKIRNALRLVAVDEAASARGLSPGLTLADARARIPELEAEEADSAADHALLERIADWCDRYTPLVSFDPPDGLVLDISGCAHLFGGEDKLLADLTGRLGAQGFAARAAIAGTMAAAEALARHAPGTIVPSGGEREAIAGLPVAALRLENGPGHSLPGSSGTGGRFLEKAGRDKDVDITDLLAQVGLRRIADLVGRPRAPLAARFGLGLVTRLDQALGQAGETLTPRRAPPALVAERRFAEAVIDRESVLHSVHSLARTLSESLEARGEGARLLEVALYRVDGAVTRTLVGTGRPLRDPALVLRLFTERLKGTETEIDAGFGFDLIRLSVLEVSRDDPRQIDLERPSAGDESVDSLVDRLGARIGLEAVSRFIPGDSHLPEKEGLRVPAACVQANPGKVGTGLPSGFAPAKEAGGRNRFGEKRFRSGTEALSWIETAAAAIGAGEPPSRPVRFFSPPEPIETLAEVPEGPPIRFRWRRVSYDVRVAEGPERITPPWWQGASGPARDYFRVEDRDGRRFWMFREGLYDGAEGAPPPRWFMQGLFA